MVVNVELIHRKDCLSLSRSKADIQANVNRQRALTFCRSLLVGATIHSDVLLDFLTC